jgi:hypothetical protein
LAAIRPGAVEAPVELPARHGRARLVLAERSTDEEKEPGGEAHAGPGNTARRRNNSVNRTQEQRSSCQNYCNYCTP